MNTEELPVIFLGGSPLERGRIHGETLRGSIRSLHEIFQDQFASVARAGVSSVKQFLADFHASTHFVRDIEQWTPGLLDELRGIAEGTALSFEQVFELNLIDEIWSRAARLSRPEAPKACTAFGVVSRAGEPTWSGQNMDVGTWLEGYQTLLRVHPQNGTPDAYLYAYAGSIGINGMNDAPLGVSCNSLVMLRNASSGVPVLFILRRLLECRTMSEAVQFLRAVPHASGQNYLVAAPGTVRSFECSAGGVAEYEPNPAHLRVCHANHPLASADRDPAIAFVSASSHARMASINARLGQSDETVTLDTIKRALAAHDDPDFPVSVVGGEPQAGYTLGSSIYELSGTPKLHQAAGPPCSTAWKTFEF